MYKIIIDAGHGGNDSGINLGELSEKDYTLLISNYIYNRLNQLNIPTKTTRNQDINLTDSERVSIIKQLYNPSNDVIVISNQINEPGNGTEIIYALRNNDELAKTIANQITTEGGTVSKYYQQRLPNNTSKDYNYLIRETENNQTIIIEYDISDNFNQWEDYAEAVVQAIVIYTNNNYIPINGDKYYTVKSGDSLYKIANQFNTTINELKTLNNLSSNSLSVGQILKIPSSSSSNNNSSSLYTVKSGDSLYKIANQFNTTVNELKILNNLSSNSLSIGQTLKIPSSSSSNNNSVSFYTVKSGDSLYKIASQFNTTVNELKNLNNLSTNLLSIGQTLKIPSSSSPNNNSVSFYTVKSGDSLYKIANQFNTTVNEIKNLNNLSTNLLSIGQTLKIPK